MICGRKLYWEFLGIDVLIVTAFSALLVMSTVVLSKLRLNLFKGTDRVKKIFDTI